MKAIRLKINIVIVFLLMAIVAATIIYFRRGFSITTEQEIAFCGTNSVEPIITNLTGQKLYNSNCSSCHAITKDLTGPALAGFQNRLPDKYYYLLIQNPQKAYWESKYLLQLKQQYQTEHFSFPNLSRDNIRDIKKYILEAC